MLAIVIIVAALLAGLGIVLFAMGMRGRRVDDHPLCRHCGFDLTGKPAESTICAECGADLTQRKAIRIGHRVRRQRLIAAGVLAILPALLLFACVFAGANFNPYKPTMLLSLESIYVGGRSDAALTELLNRLAAGSLSQRQIDFVVARALDIQADRSRSWSTKLGDFIEGARAASMLSDEHWRRYANQAAQEPFTMDIRPHVRRGDPMPVWINAGKARVGSKHIFEMHVKRRYSVDGIVVERGWEGTDTEPLVNSRGSRTGYTLPLGEKALAQLKDGPHTFIMESEIEIQDQRAKKKIDNAGLSCKLALPFELHPADRPTVKIVKNDALRKQIEDCLKVTQLTLGKWSRDQLSITVQTQPPPVGIGFETFIRVRGEEVSIGKFARPAGRSAHGFGTGTTAPQSLMKMNNDDPIKQVDIIFRSSPAAAAATLDVFEIWEGEIELKDQPFPINR
jgi:hypothetical protein